MSSTDSAVTANTSWGAALRAFLDSRLIAMFFLGFSAGIPLLLIFSSLSLWLREAGVDRGAVTFFSWAALGYSFKFVWAPLVDHVPWPFLTRWLGRRRAWLLVAACIWFGFETSFNVGFAAEAVQHLMGQGAR